MDWFTKTVVAVPYLVASWAITLLGIAILIFPTILVWKKAGTRFARWRTTFSGFVFGLLVIPLSFWLYFQYYLGPVRALVFVFIGLFSIMFHLAPFENVSIPFLLKATDTAKGTWGTGVGSHLIIGGIFWGTVYATLGTIIDYIRKRRGAF